MEDLKSELDAENKALEYANDMITSKLAPKCDKLYNMTQKLERKQVELDKKSDKILQILLDSNRPELTELEIEFFDEIKEINSRIRSLFKPAIHHVIKFF